MNVIKKYFHVKKLNRESDNLLEEMTIRCLKYDYCTKCPSYRPKIKETCLFLGELMRIEKEVEQLTSKTKI